MLAHELGHALELHPETGLVRAMGLSAAAQLVFAGSSGTLSNIGLLLTQLRYTRIAEREADAHALRILKGAGISPKGFGDFFERLEGKRHRRGAAQDASPELELIRTHPLTADRIAMVRAQPAYPATPALPTRTGARCATPADRRRRRRPAARTGTGRADAAGRSTHRRRHRRPRQGRPEADREIAEATKTLEANPNDVAALQKRARAYARKGKHELALGDYVKAAALKPDDAACTTAAARAAEPAALRGGAARLRRGAAAGAQPRNARNNRGNVNRALKRYEAALQDFDELIRVKPDFIHAYYNRGLALREMNRPEEALRDFTATHRAGQGLYRPPTPARLLHEKTGAREKAIADFRAALAAPPKYNNGAWAHRTARERLKALGVEAP